MKSDSIRLSWAGAMIGVLVLSASAFARTRPPARAGGHSETRAAETAATAELPVRGTEAAALPVMAEQTTRFRVAFRTAEPAPEERLFLCDAAGCPLEPLEPDPDGDGSLGPLAPGRYTLCAGAERIGAFRLLENGALAEAEGRAWTDGELLRLERFVPCGVGLELSLAAPGYYSFQLTDRDGRTRSRDLYIPDGTLPELGGRYRRTLVFRGLPPGLYTAVWRGEPLGQTQAAAGELAVLELRIDK